MTTTHDEGVVMAQYLLAVHSSAADYARPIEEMMPAFEATERFNQEARAAGVWVFANGLKSGDLATVVDGTGATPVTTDGPYLETKEWLGGFWVLELPDLDAALSWATRASAACGAKVEVRPFQEEPE
jgi:hypothetical protein